MSDLITPINETNIPSFTLDRQNTLIREELLECFLQVVDKGVFILHENVKALEDKVSSFCQTSYGVGVSSGSEALTLSLIACGIGPGDEVITTPFTFFATASSISRVGAKPVFVDIDPQTWNINANLIKEKITSKTKAIIPVHLFGCPAEMNTICQVAKENNLKVIEDAAQAIGAEYHGQRVGSLGDTGCFSFFPTKNLGAFGDGGMIVAKDSELEQQLRLLRIHGAKTKYYHDTLGFNSRLDELQAAILNLKFKYIEEWTRKRREIAQLYNKLLQKHIDKGTLSIKLPREPENSYHVYHQYTIQTIDRDQLQDHLKKYGIKSTVYYPIPLHLQKVYSSLGYEPGNFPISEAACKEVLSLPMFPELTNKEVEIVVDKIVGFFAEN